MGVVLLSGCSSGHSSPTPTATKSTSTTPTTSAASTVPTPSTTSTGSGAPQNLAATSAVKSQLTAAFVAHNGLPADEVAGTAPGSVYDAYLPSSSTYWALASFVPTANASYQTQVALQDEGATGIFTQSSGGAWTYVSGYLGAPCPGQIPAELETLWNLQAPGGCASTTTTSP